MALPSIHVAALAMTCTAAFVLFWEVWELLPIRKNHKKSQNTARFERAKAPAQAPNAGFFAILWAKLESV
jgi:hypothetical protein